MSKRLQVLLKEDEYREIQRIAKRHRVTVAEWVRQALREARRDEPIRNRERKLAVLREAVKHQHPIGDIEQVLEELEHRYDGDWPKE